MPRYGYLLGGAGTSYQPPLDSAVSEHLSRPQARPAHWDLPVEECYTSEPHDGERCGRLSAVYSAAYDLQNRTPILRGSSAIFQLNLSAPNACRKQPNFQDQPNQ